MLDFHTHILPAMDDGSRDAECSLRMLQSSMRQGVDTIVLTPHFYAAENSPQHFLQRRARAAETLQMALQGMEESPRLLLGSEVHYYAGIGQSTGVEQLAIEGTDVLLLELPFSQWPGILQDDLRNLQRQGLQVVLAHVERYISRWNAARVTDELLSTGAILQSNAEFFIDRRSRKLALRLLEENRITVLGSDAHNMENRAPNLGEAAQVIREALGEAGWEFFSRQAYEILGLGATV